MASRNRLLNGPVGEKEAHIKMFASFAWHKKTGEQRLFKDRTEYVEAIGSGEWVSTPTKIDKGFDIKKDMENIEFIQVDGPSGAMVEADEDDELEEEDPTKDDLTVLTDPSKHRPSTDHTQSYRPMPKYLAFMNVAELILTGKELGLDFSDRKKTRKEMRTMIQKARLEKMTK